MRTHRNPLIKSNTDSQPMLCFHHWWNERLNEGCQLSNLDNFDRGWDYIRRSDPENNWLRTVALEALHQDYNCRFPSALLDKRVFKQNILEIEDTTHIRRHMRLYIEHGLYRGRVRPCITFGKQRLTPRPIEW